MKKAMYVSILIAAMSFTLMFTACEKKGPAEKAGEQIDQAMEPAGPMEKAGEKIDNAVEQTKEAVEDATK